MPAKHKTKPKGKGRSKAARNKAKPKKPAKTKGSNHSSPKQKQYGNDKQQQAVIASMLKCIDEMYNEHTHKYECMKTFFGIFTKHNQLQLTTLMEASIADIAADLSDSFLRTTQNDQNRDLNQFIFLGDVVIGAYATQLIKENGLDCCIKAFCILPYFQNYGFGARLLVNLIKNAVKRQHLVSLSLQISASNTKAISFFERFGFKQLTCDTEHKSDEATSQMKLDLQLLRSSLMVLINKQGQGVK